MYREFQLVSHVQRHYNRSQFLIAPSVALVLSHVKSVQLVSHVQSGLARFAMNIYMIGRCCFDTCFFLFA